MTIVYIMAIIFTVLGIYLLTGRGGWLIAGYNTASKEEKEKYDEKKLCRSMGVLMLVIAVIICLTAYVNTDEFAMKMIAPILIAVGVEMVYANKFCNKK
ncbi:DUF3784 domain-containing protein [Konateibacter massiliensis]|uniref:DUF3784 domain-containing protein n=1 Tax=Konateibacter massiliensis TaxID=2002841 RepID=UPI000C15D81A|nr:DUF3784 domain-containing protein [Konateibacter massiliensis]